MQLMIHFLVCWALAFGTLGLALVLLNIYDSLIGNDLTLRSLGQETAIAGVASLIQGASLWVVASFLPTAARALFIPALIVAIVYKLSHLEDWSRYDVLMLFLFQTVIGCSLGLLFFGHLQAVLIVFTVFGGFLAIVASIMRRL